MVNLKNKTNVLFVCDHNKFRSPTAKRLYSHNEDLEVKSLGIRSSKKSLFWRRVFKWADRIFVMEPHHKALVRRELHHLFGEEVYREIICLYIPDRYPYLDGRLLGILEGHLSLYLGPPSFSPQPALRRSKVIKYHHRNYSQNRAWMAA